MMNSRGLSQPGKNKFSMKIDKNFLEICKRFNKYGVKYVVCGAYACKLHGIEEISGQERFTLDYDFIIEPSAENAKRVKEALKEINPEAEKLRDDDFKNYQSVKVVGEVEIDLISTLWEVDYKTASEDMIVKEIENIKISVLSIDKLIKTKKDSFRERDKVDAYWLNKIKERDNG